MCTQRSSELIVNTRKWTQFQTTQSLMAGGRKRLLASPALLGCSASAQRLRSKSHGNQPCAPTCSPLPARQEQRGKGMASILARIPSPGRKAASALPAPRMPGAPSLERGQAEGRRSCPPTACEATAAPPPLHAVPHAHKGQRPESCRAVRAARKPRKGQVGVLPPASGPASSPLLGLPECQGPRNHVSSSQRGSASLSAWPPWGCINAWSPGEEKRDMVTQTGISMREGPRKVPGGPGILAPRKVWVPSGWDAMGSWASNSAQQSGPVVGKVLGLGSLAGLHPPWRFRVLQGPPGEDGGRHTIPGCGCGGRRPGQGPS